MLLKHIRIVYWEGNPFFPSWCLNYYEINYTHFVLFLYLYLCLLVFGIWVVVEVSKTMGAIKSQHKLCSTSNVHLYLTLKTIQCSMTFVYNMPKLRYFRDKAVKLYSIKNQQNILFHYLMWLPQTDRQTYSCGWLS